MTFLKNKIGFIGLSHMIGAASSASSQNKILNAETLASPLGEMIVIADEEALYLLEFMDGRGVAREVERLSVAINAVILPGQTPPMHSIQKELDQYFDGKLRHFKTPLHFLGTPFQKRVWKELMSIPYGETRSYLDIAKATGNPLATRAVANANGKNQMAIINPCHRVIQANGNIGGYAGGIHRKQHLLALEKNNA